MLSNFLNFKDIKGLGNVKHHLHRILHNTLGNQKLQLKGKEKCNILYGVKHTLMHEYTLSFSRGNAFNTLSSWDDLEKRRSSYLTADFGQWLCVIRISTFLAPTNHYTNTSHKCMFFNLLNNLLADMAIMP